MRKFVLAAAALLSLSSSTWAAFGIFQTALVDEVAVTTCNINTGVATGLDAGTCASPAANCNGVADNTAAFTSFNTWAKATTTNANGQLIELVVTGNCVFTTGNAPMFNRVAKSRLMGYGATFTATAHTPSISVASQSSPAPGICHFGLDNASGCSARINTVLAGATSVTINLTGYSGALSTLCSRFVTGQWAVVTGFDLQGNLNSFGYPPNPYFYNYVQIGSTAACAGSGVIQINSSLSNSYLSTWPNFGSGTSLEADQGGPATIYALDPWWGGQTDIRGVTFTEPTNQLNPIGRSVTFRDVTMTGVGCIIPSQNDTFTMVNSTGTNCIIEVDKIINNLTYQGTTLKRLGFQSSSVNTLTWDGGALTQDMNGTPKVAVVSNLTTPSFRIGPYAYGTATSASCTNCVITNPITVAGLTEDGAAAAANIFYTVSSGVFSYPVSQTVTNLIDNGAGKIRFSVANATGWAVGAGIGINGIGSCSPSCSSSTILSVDTIGNTIDVNLNFSSVTWGGAGTLFNNAEQERWAIPGTNVTATGISAVTAGWPFFQVTGVTQSGGFVNIATTLAGGYPNVPLPGSGKSNLLVQTPKWTCTNCSGNVQMSQDFAAQPPNTPTFSYSNRSYTNLTSLLNTPLWGKVTSIKINVTQAYTGATNPMTFGFNDQAVTSAGVFTSWNGPINLRQSGLRTITPAGVTCDTGGGPVAGSCSGDGALTLTDPAMMFAGTMNLSKPNGSPTDQPWAMNYEFIMDQGVVP